MASPVTKLRASSKQSIPEVEGLPHELGTKSVLKKLKESQNNSMASASEFDLQKDRKI